MIIVKATGFRIRRRREGFAADLEADVVTSGAARVAVWYWSWNERLDDVP